MKKSILIATALFLSSFAFSQSSSGGASGFANGADKNFHFGISVVPGLDWFSPGSTSSISNTSYKNAGNGMGLGFGFGVNLEFYFTQNYGFVTGLTLANMPGKYTTTSTTTSGSVTDSTVTSQHKLKMQYLEVPLMFKFRTLPVGLFRYFAVVGFNPGVRLSSKDDYTINGSTPISTFSRTGSGINANNETSVVRIPYVFGLGIEYNIAGTTSLQAIVSYDADFINISTIDGNSVTSKAITLTLGVLF